MGQRIAALNAERNAGDQYFCPQLPASPNESILLLENLLRPYAPQDVTLIGSSLGGYYATWLAEKHGCRAVLLNPMTKLMPEFEQFVGVTTSFHSDEPFEFKREYIDHLRAMSVTQITRPERYFLIAAKGDELLDWRDMVTHYPNARQIVLEGSDHGLTGFEDYLDDVLAFAGIAVPKKR
jgi:predicted esterase YcpF (UPF0227 family)